MKANNIVLFCVVLLSLISNKIYPQIGNEEPPLPQIEIYFDNLSSFDAIVQCYPVSAVINGDNELNLLAKEPNHSINIWYDYINCVRVVNNQKLYTLSLGSGSTNRGFNFDCEDLGGPPDNSEGTFGRGVYKIIYKYYNYVTQQYMEDSVKFEQDAGANYDLHIILRNDCQPYGGNSGSGLTYKLEMPYPYGWGDEKAVTLTDGYIKMWDPYPYIENAFRRNKEFGNFNYSSGTTLNNPYNIMPMDCRVVCNILPGITEQNQFFPDNILETDNRQGILTLNLSIRKDIQTPTQGYQIDEIPMPIIITQGAYLRICEGINLERKFTLNPFQGYTNRMKLITEQGGKLWLESSNSIGTRAIVEINNLCDINNNGVIIFGTNSNIIIYPGGALYLQPLSEVRASNNSKIIVHSGGTYCNYGAYITGNLTVQYLGGIHSTYCSGYNNDMVFDDSTKVILSDSAVLEIPDNTSLIFDNPETVLQMDSNSTIKFGNNSKLIVRNGARLNAYKANFTSLNANSVWDGIYLEDLSKDTIRYCNIENAVSGINIKDKNNSGGTPGIDPVTIISDCSFKNTTNNTFTSGIYAANSNNILLKNNTFNSTSINIGFSSGILLEYCPSGNINLINNNVDYSATGIVVIQSSPYISRNTITGRTNSSYGIFLDNAGGNIKYNTVNNFATSFISYYSSPNLFRNSFLNASESNLELLTYSTPLMRPVNTESEIIWLGGNNTISGTPAISGIEFYGESYPESDLGYNIENVNGADYMKGDIPTVMDGMLSSTYNYWGTSNPDPNKFDVQYGNVEFEPVYDGVTPIDYDDYQLNDIGFGLYDTVLIKNLGDISGGALLFMQAYNKEKQSDFSGAILLYKQVISSYKKSYYAAASVIRIFSCLEKIKNINNFILQQNFLSQLRINQNIPFILRELAEDYIIKCKVKRGMLTEAISDYNNIYLLNQNNSKGAHALLNKECLTSMLHDTTDGMSGDILEHKYNIYEKITNKSLNHIYSITKEGKPDQYSLSDNYPNPFNPVTNIGYELPNDAFVKIGIFDILGREVSMLVNEFKSGGRYIVAFNASNLPSGIYFYKLEAKEQTGSNKMFTLVKKMLLVK